MKDFTYNIDTNIENDTHMRMIADVTIRNPLREEIKFDTKCFFDTGSVHSYISTDAKDKLELTPDTYRKFSFDMGGKKISSYPYSIGISFPNSNNNNFLQSHQVFEFQDVDSFHIQDVHMLIGMDIIQLGNLHSYGQDYKFSFTLNSNFTKF